MAYRLITSPQTEPADSGNGDMMNFRFAISSTLDGSVLGLNDEALAMEISADQDFYVIDMTTGEWIDDGERKELESFTG